MSASGAMKFKAALIGFNLIASALLKATTAVQERDCFHRSTEFKTLSIEQIGVCHSVCAFEIEEQLSGHAAHLDSIQAEQGIIAISHRSAQDVFESPSDSKSAASHAASASASSRRAHAMQIVAPRSPNKSTQATCRAAVQASLDAIQCFESFVEGQSQQKQIDPQHVGRDQELHREAQRLVKEAQNQVSDWQTSLQHRSESVSCDACQSIPHADVADVLE